jgi:hypothetical protein
MFSETPVREPQNLHSNFVGIEVLTQVVMNSTIFCDITLCSPLKVNRRFGGTYYLHLQVEKWAEQDTRVKAGGKKRIKRRYVPRKRRLTFNGLHGVLSQKILLFIINVFPHLYLGLSSIFNFAFSTSFPSSLSCVLHTLPMSFILILSP